MPFSQGRKWKQKADSGAVADKVQGAVGQAGQLGSRSTKPPGGESSPEEGIPSSEPNRMASNILDQLKNLKTYSRGQILQEAKEVGSSINQLLCKLDFRIHPEGKPGLYLGPQSLPLSLWLTQTSPRIMFCCVKAETLGLT